MRFSKTLLLPCILFSLATSVPAADVEISREWTVFGPLPKASLGEVPEDMARTIPDRMTVGGENLEPQVIEADVTGLADLSSIVGSEAGAGAYVFIPVEVGSVDQDVTFGFGADWWLTAWLDGKQLVDTWQGGNQSGGMSLFPPSAGDFRASVNLDAGDYLLVLRFARGSETALLAAGEAPERSEAGANWWQTEDPLYAELLSDNMGAFPTRIPGKSAYSFTYEIMVGGSHVIPPFRPWALRTGMPYAVGDMLASYEAHRMHPAENAARLDQTLADTLIGYESAARMGGAPGMVLTTGGGLVPWTEAQIAREMDRGREALAKYGAITWGLFFGDEQTRKAEAAFLLGANDNPGEWSNRKKLKSFERQVARGQIPVDWIREQAEQLRETFGYGHLDLPRTFLDEDRFEWLAFRRWLIGHQLGRQEALWKLARDHEAKTGQRLPVMDNDDRGAGGVNLHQLSRFAPFADIFTHQAQGSSGTPWRQRVAFLTKVMADLTGKAVWPVVHTGTHGGIKTAEEVNDHLSEIARAGGSGVGFWTRDQAGRTGKRPDSMTDYYGHPGRWKVMMNAVDRLRLDPRPAYPEPEFAIFLSNDTAMSMPNGKIPSEDEILFNFLGPNARTWFRFVSDIQLLDGKARLADWPVVVLGMTDIQRTEVAEQFLDYPRDGRVLVATHPEPFAHHADGSATPEFAAELFGVEVGERKRARHVELRRETPLLPGWKVGDRLRMFGGQPAREVEPLEGAEVLAVFDDGTPAIIQKVHPGDGQALYFAFETGLMYIRDASWRRFYTSLAKGFGLTTGQDIWRLTFPMPPLDAPSRQPGDPVCLTGNDFQWWENEILTFHNAEVPGGRYRYSRLPDALGDEGESDAAKWIAFDDGDLTDRLDFLEEGEDTAEGPIDEAAVAWATGESVSITVDLGEARRLDRVVLVHGGARPEVRVKVSPDGERYQEVGASPAEAARFEEDVAELSLVLESSESRYVRVELGPLPKEKPFVLAELEVWGAP